MYKFRVLISLFLIPCFYFFISCKKDEKDNTKPICTIIKPNKAESFEHGEKIVIKVEASDQDGVIEHIEIFIDNNSVISSGENFLSYQWETSLANIGEHTIKAIAEDDDNESSSDAVKVELFKDNEQPTCSIVSPLDSTNITRGEEVVISVEASDTANNVQILIDDKTICTIYDTPYEHTWNSQSYETGFHEIKAIVGYNNSVTSIDSITIQLKNGNIIQGDTIYPGNILNASGFTLYTVNDQNGYYGGYLTGINAYQDLSKAQQFIVNDNGYILKGAIYWFGVKRVHGNGKIKLNLWDMNGTAGTSTEGVNNQACPGDLLISEEVIVSNVDTSSSISSAHIQMLNSEVEVSSDYAMGVNMENLYSNNDTIALVTSMDGDGNNMELAWEQWNDGTWKTLMYSYGGLDVDIAIFPLLASEAANVPGGNFIFGMKMSPSQNTIKSNAVIIDYELERASSQVILEIYDILGNQLYHKKLGGKKAGDHTAKAFVRLNKGKYVYVLHANGKKLAKELIIN